MMLNNSLALYSRKHTAARLGIVRQLVSSGDWQQSYFHSYCYSDIVIVISGSIKLPKLEDRCHTTSAKRGVNEVRVFHSLSLSYRWQIART